MDNNSENSPLVSVGLMTYNRAHYLPGVIDCWLAQTHKNIELIISDDASTDGTQKICEEYAKKDPRIKYFRQKKNLNAPGCYKFVFQQARGKYFIWASDDDLWDKLFLEDCIKVFNKDPELIMVFADMVDIDKERNVMRHLDPLRYMPLKRGLYARLKEYILFHLTEDGKIQLIFGLWKREAVLSEPLFGYRERDDRFPYYMGFDSLFILRNLAKGPFGFVPETRFFRRSRILEEYRSPRPFLPRIALSFYRRLETIFGSPYFWYIFVFAMGVKELSLWQRMKLAWWNLFAMSRLFWKRKI